VTSNRLNTPGLQRLIQVGDDDGISVLRKEINESKRRMLAAKKGAPVANVSPRHDTSFYFPD